MVSRFSDKLSKNDAEILTYFKELEDNLTAYAAKTGAQPEGRYLFSVS